jgi:hypothetical protein
MHKHPDHDKDTRLAALYQRLADSGLTPAKEHDIQLGLRDVKAQAKIGEERRHTTSIARRRRYRPIARSLRYLAGATAIVAAIFFIVGSADTSPDAIPASAGTIGVLVAIGTVIAVRRRTTYMRRGGGEHHQAFTELAKLAGGLTKVVALLIRAQDRWK